MEIELQWEDFRSVLSLLTSEGPDQSGIEGRWSPETLARAVDAFGVMGWDLAGRPGHFGPSSEEAKLVLSELRSFRLDWDQHAGDYEAFSTRYEDGPLDRFGWDEPHVPDFVAVERGEFTKARPQSAENERNSLVRLIGVLTHALLRRRGFEHDPSFGGIEPLAVAVAAWAKDEGIRGLADTSVKQKLREALRVIGSNGPD